MISKEDIRSKFKEQRAQVSPELQNAQSAALVRHFLRLRYGVSWLLYAPIQNEISTQPLFDLAIRERGDRVYFPRVSGDHLSFHQVKSWSDLKPGKFCLEPASYAEAWDPSQASVVVVPGLAFSARGDRIGYGKGFYDRFLREHRHLPRLAIGYDFQITSALWTNEPMDERMDYIITPSAVWGSPRVMN